MCNALALAVLSALLFTRASAQTQWIEAAASPRIGIFIHFDNIPNASSIKAMQREVGAVLAATGAKFSWLMMDTEEQTQTFDDLAILRFEGSCRMGAAFPATGGGKPVTLAATELSQEEVSSYGSVQCDQIRSTIFSLLGEPYARDGDAAFGRALGRVVAHELYHILARTEEHTRSGVTKALQTPFDLVRDNFH